jgi:hypothetical protein
MKTACNAAVWFDWRQGHAAKVTLAVDEDALVIADIAELVQIDFMLLGLRAVATLRSPMDS